MINKKIYEIQVKINSIEKSLDVRCEPQPLLTDMKFAPQVIGAVTRLLSSYTKISNPHTARIKMKKELDELLTGFYEAGAIRFPTEKEKDEGTLTIFAGLDN